MPFSGGASSATPTLVNQWLRARASSSSLLISNGSESLSCAYELPAHQDAPTKIANSWVTVSGRVAGACGDSAGESGATTTAAPTPTASPAQQRSAMPIFVVNLPSSDERSDRNAFRFRPLRKFPTKKQNCDLTLALLRRETLLGGKAIRLAAIAAAHHAMRMYARVDARPRSVTGLAR